MNVKMIRYIISKMMGAEGLLMLLPMMVGIIYGEHTSVYFLITAAILTAIYLLFGRKCPENMTIYAKEGLIIVATAWIFWSLAGALPFVLSKSIPSYVDAFFETVSGFTTTGSTILTEIEGLPKGILFWRSLTHWVGGMGVLVFVMVLTSLDEKNSMHLMRAEVPGPEADKLVPKARGTARILYGMYFALTTIEVVFLLAGGMNLFDAVTHAFSTAGTGGFSGYNASVAHFNSAYIDGVITVFMILFGINFNLYFFLLLKEFKSVFKNEELRAYLGIIAGATVVITCNIAGGYHSLLKAFRYAAFQVASVITTTGFVTADFNKWPELSKCVLLLVMVIGASAGSTGGGIKVSRVIVMVKSFFNEIRHIINPSSVTAVRANGKPMDKETLIAVRVYAASYFILICLFTLVISLNGLDFTTNLTAVLSCFNNIGPGLNLVGPMSNFSCYADWAQVILSIAMLTGRLEIFPMFMLFSKSVHRR